MKPTLKVVRADYGTLAGGDVARVAEWHEGPAMIAPRNHATTVKRILRALLLICGMAAGYLPSTGLAGRAGAVVLALAFMFLALAYEAATLNEAEKR